MFGSITKSSCAIDLQYKVLPAFISESVNADDWYSFKKYLPEITFPLQDPQAPSWQP